MKKFAALVTAFAAAFLCLPFFSGCSAGIGYTLESAEDGSRYYVARASGYTSFMSGELEIPAEYGEGEEKLPVKAIAAQGFSGTKLKKITIPASVETIGVAAFSYNNLLEEVTFAEGSKIKEIGWGAFGYCRSLAAVNIPETVETVDGMAFAYCESIKTLDLPDGLKNINFRAFEGCSALEEIILPQNLLQIGAYAFYNCTALGGIVLPDSLRDEVSADGEISPAVGFAAFHTCTSLKYAVVGAGIVSIEEGVFGYCTSLERVYLPAGLKRIKGALFSNDGAFVCGHAFHNDGALAEVHFAGSEEEWAAVEIDDVPYSGGSTEFNNGALKRARKIFNSAYADK